MSKQTILELLAERKRVKEEQLRVAAAGEVKTNSLDAVKVGPATVNHNTPSNVANAGGTATPHTAEAVKPFTKVLPDPKLSLADRLRLKAQEREKAAASAESEVQVSSSIADADANAQQTVFVSSDPVLHRPVELEVPPVQEAPRKPDTVLEGAVPVIEVLKKFYNLQEVQAEVKKLQNLTSKVKSNALLHRLALFTEAAQNLENLIDLQEGLEGPDSLAKTKVADALHEALSATAQQEHPATEVVSNDSSTFSLSITLNERQLMAKEMALSGKSFCLIGAAGTGKTTSQRSVAEALLQDDRLTECSYKRPGGQGKDDRVSGPSFVACAFTRRASANLARAIHKNPALEEALRYNIMTIHQLLEFEPVYFYDVEKQRDSMRFEPQRTASNPLTITHLVIEESSMVGLDLFAFLFDALPLGVQIIYIGDINQLPPVFGMSILNYALVQLPVIELTEVYRQAEDSSILANAHRVLKGESIQEAPGTTIIRGKQTVQVGQEKMALALSKMFKIWHDEGFYDPEQDMILSPFNKHALGTDNLNKWIAQFLGEKRKAVVFEILAGFAKHYLAVGDRVMVNKQDGYVIKIVRNMSYLGATPQMEGADLSRFGHRIAGTDNALDLDEEDPDGIALLNYENFNLDSIGEQQGERKIQCSHIIDVLLESGEVVSLSSAGDLGPQNFSLGYVLTVHKAQGCEFRRVFGVLHKDHAVMLFRELLYTLMTRAREDLVLIAKDWVLDKAIKSQRIKGDTLQDKIEYFNSGAVDLVGGISCTK